MLRATLSVLALALAATGTAGAGTARFVPDSPQNFPTVLYEAAEGEANNVTVTRPGEVVFHDAGAPITAGNGCVPLDANTVSCGWSGGYVVWEVRAGDLDDIVSAAGFCTDCEESFSAFTIHGGAGDDTLIGGRETMRLFGGAGDDVLQGGPFDDRLHGGAGADAMDGGGDEDDGDVVSYRGHVAPVRVDVGAATAGSAGEGDTIANVEGAFGGAADDRLVGDARRNWLVGGGGSDAILGRRGGDRLAGGAGDDVIRAGAGADGVEGGRGRDQISGGPGDDWIDGGEITGEPFVGGEPVRGADTILAGPGRDTVFASGGNDWVSGGDGPDFLVGGAGRDVLRGGRGRDSLTAMGGSRRPDDGVADRLFGGLDRDEAWAHANDRLRGIEVLHRL